MEKQFKLFIDTKRNGFNTVRGLKQGDNNSVLNITLVQNSVPFNLENYTVRINYRRPDNKIFLQMADIRNSVEGKIKINVLTQVLENVGEVLADLSIFDTNNRKITSVTFSMFVDASIYRNDYIEPEELDIIQSIWVEEDKRIKQENTRQTNETTRISNENTRKSNEDTRIQTEKERVEAETNRVDDENIRKSNETNRDDAEKIRQANEKARLSNEDIRATNENKRAEAEKTREAQETTRQQGYTNMQNTIDDFSACEEYDSTKQYKKFNRVTLNGSSYEAIKDVPKGVEPINSEHWICIAKKGIDGTGTGNMHTDTYDKDNNGIVDKAESITNGSITYTAQDIQDKFNNIDIDKVEKKTYAELNDLKTNKKLKVGFYYMLTDYKTKYLQPSTKVIKEAKETEELILFAVSEDKFATQVYSTKYPQDIIHYDPHYSMCGDDKTPRPGFIIRRHDTITGNNCPYDFRTMLWARWCPDENQYYKNDKLVDYEVWTEGEVKFDVLYKADNQLLLAKQSGTPKNATDGNYFTPVYSNTEIGCLTKERTETFNESIDIKKGELQERLTFGANCTNNTFGGGCMNNVLGDNCYNNTFGCGCHSNTFGIKCTQNILGNTCTSNIFKGYCSGNIFDNSCNRNIIGENSDDNYFSNYCDDNIFGYACNENTFGNGCRANRFSNHCTHNTFENDCYKNSFDTSCDDNHFQNSCDSNTFKDTCHKNTFGNDCDGNTFGRNCYGNIFGNGCTNNSFYESCRWNSFGTVCNLNKFGAYCNYNTLNNDCYSNTFSDDVKNIIIECLRNRNLKSISDIKDKDFTITVTKGKDSNYYYHFYNGSSEEYHQIP